VYNAFFELERAPFSMTPDPAFLFLSVKHLEALAGLVLAVSGKKGFVVLTGEAGTGKTTLLNRTLRSIPKQKAQFSFIINPTLNPSEFLEMAMIDFGIEDVPPGKPQRLLKLQKFLMDAYEAKKTCVLVIDEAHKLTPEVLEEVRLLTNFESAEQKLLQIVLAGQPELSGLLNREDMRQLKQRVAIRLRIDPLEGTEVDRYLIARWERAGARTLHPFTAPAISLISRASKGIPRVINAICDNALTNAFGESVKVIDGPQILDVLDDLQIDPPGSANDAPVNGSGARQNGMHLPPPLPIWAAATVYEPVPTTFRSLERYMPKPEKPTKMYKLRIRNS
jgi:general secretion pathway protein A